ncbi:MAG: DUF2207 domain-containing protein [Patescibacteria group bacterium]
MKKILIGLLLFFVLTFPVSAQIDDIQPDAVNLNAIYPTDSVEPTNNITGEHIKSFHSEVLINKDGTIDVKETIIYNFDSLQKHGIYREIPFIKTNQDGKKYKLEFNNFSVVDEKGGGYQFSRSFIDEKNIRLKIGDADKLITGIHTYVISYKVAGALTYFSDHDELYWNVTGNDWQIPIASTTSQVVWPQEIKKEDIKTACYTGIYGSKVSDCNYFVDDLPAEALAKEGRIQDNIKTNRILFSGEGLTVVISFPKNIVAVLEPKEFVSFWETWVGKLVMGLMGLIGLIWYVFLPFYIIYRWIKYGRDPKGMAGVTTAWFDPPKTQDGKRFLTPGEVGTLGDETVDMKDISATIVDLARRGYLIIDERKKGDYYLIKNKNIDSGLLTYERSIMTKFFGNEKEIRIKDEELSAEVVQIKKEMYEQVVEDKLFDKNPETTRTKYYVLAGIALFTSNFFLAIVAFLFGRVMPRKTEYGAEAKNISFSLKNFLSSQKRQLEFQADKQMMFERLLPFAVAFGVEKIWAKRFESLNITQPNWYHSYSGANFNSYLLVNSLNSSFKSISTAATPTRSSSGFSSGFGGGGFSGGGGGGGGGGSW